MSTDLRRLADESWVKTLAKFVFASVTYQIMGIGTLIALLVVTLLSF